MSSAHFYDLEQEWRKFLNDLNTRCQRRRVPFMVEELPADFVPRDRELNALVDLLIERRSGDPVAITAALRGAGGYGKTTLARAVCYNEEIQHAFDDGILWVTLGENPGDLIDKVADLIGRLSGERPGFTGLDAGSCPAQGSPGRSRHPAGSRRRLGPRSSEAFRAGWRALRALDYDAPCRYFCRRNRSRSQSIRCSRAKRSR